MFCNTSMAVPVDSSYPNHEKEHLDQQDNISRSHLSGYVAVQAPANLPQEVVSVLDKMA